MSTEIFIINSNQFNWNFKMMRISKLHFNAHILWKEFLLLTWISMYIYIPLASTLGVLAPVKHKLTNIHILCRMRCHMQYFLIWSFLTGQEGPAHKALQIFEISKGRWPPSFLSDTRAHYSWAQLIWKRWLHPSDVQYFVIFNVLEEICLEDDNFHT